MICERCHAGQMVEYERRVGPAAQKGVTLRGKKCEMCGYTQLDSDDDVWSAVGL